MKGGDIWSREIQKQIDRCHTCLVVISAEAAASDYMSLEYGRALRLKKRVIPLYWRLISDEEWPIEFERHQRVEFHNGYQRGLADLLKALGHEESRESSSTQPDTDSTSTTSRPKPITVMPPPSANLHELYWTGVKAQLEGDIERTAISWQQVLDHDPAFGNGMLTLQMRQLMAELHSIRIQRLREQAKQAHLAGIWGQEIGAWEALLGLMPEDREAKECISIAQHNQKYAWLYDNALDFASANNFAGVKTQLTCLPSPKGRGFFSVRHGASV
jgi:hypothetical protein